MKKCVSCQHELDEKVDVCPECGSSEFEEIAAETKTSNSVVTSEDTTPQEEEPIPVVGLIIAGVVGLIALAVGLYFKFH